MSYRMITVMPNETVDHAYKSKKHAYRQLRKRILNGKQVICTITFFCAKSSSPEFDSFTHSYSAGDAPKKLIDLTRTINKPSRV